jgi:5-methyltetrahydrofolate--homocysteine methyltransferase
MPDIMTTKPTIFDLVKRRPVLLDGAMGTELMKRGLPQGTCPEEWNVSNPDALKAIHRDYYEAGSDVVATNSFGGNRIMLASHGLADRCHELNYAAAKLAGEVKPEGKFVAGDLGPTGKFLKPQGEYTEDDFEKAFAVQAKGLAMGKVDFFMVETMFALREALCAVRGVRSASSLPVFVTMTFNKTPRGFFTLMGDSVRQCAEAFEKLDVPIFGANCTLTGADLADCIREMRKHTSRPLIAQPNAGKPELTDSRKVVYSQGIEEFVKDVPKLIQNGAGLVGGCCGTNPEYIRRTAIALKLL